MKEQRQSFEPGKLRHRITIESAATAQGSDGFEQKTWMELATVWAAISTIGGREFFQAKQVNAELSHEVTVRWRPGITAEQRIRFEDLANGTTRYFDILSVRNPDERRVVLYLYCRELVGKEVEA